MPRRARPLLVPPAGTRTVLQARALRVWPRKARAGAAAEITGVEAALGYFSGRELGTFRPGRAVSRARRARTAPAPAACTWRRRLPTARARGFTQAHARDTAASKPLRRLNEIRRHATHEPRARQARRARRRTRAGPTWACVENTVNALFVPPRGSPAPPTTHLPSFAVASLPRSRDQGDLVRARAAIPHRARAGPDRERPAAGSRAPP